MTLREREARSIIEFVGQCGKDGLLLGDVLDFGCGRAPYRKIVEAHGGKWFGYDRHDHAASVVPENVGDDDLFNGTYDAILCTQVVQYLSDPVEELAELRTALNVGGPLLITGPTNWPVVETADLWRWTPEGAAVALGKAGFAFVHVEPRFYDQHAGEPWLIGWKAVARG